MLCTSRTYKRRNFPVVSYDDQSIVRIPFTNGFHQFRASCAVNCFINDKIYVHAPLQFNLMCLATFTFNQSYNVWIPLGIELLAFSNSFFGVKNFFRFYRLLFPLKEWADSKKSAQPNKPVD